MSHTRRWLGAVVVVGIVLMAVAVSPFGSTSYAQEALTATTQVTTATVNPKTGALTLGGTLQCNVPAQGSLYITVRQPVGRTKSVTAGTTTQVTCNGTTPSTFSTILYATNGRFAPGRAVVEIGVFVCPTDPYPFQNCTNISQAHAVRLKSGK